MVPASVASGLGMSDAPLENGAKPPTSERGSRAYWCLAVTAPHQRPTVDTVRTRVGPAQKCTRQG